MIHTGNSYYTGQWNYDKHKNIKISDVIVINERFEQSSKHVKWIFLDNNVQIKLTADSFLNNI